MKRKTEGVDGAVLVYLSTVAILFCAFVGVMYWLLQPTVLVAARGAPVNTRPKPNVDWSAELAARQKMEETALQEARQANAAEVTIVAQVHGPQVELRNVEPAKLARSKVAARREPRVKRTVVARPQTPGLERPRETPQPPPQQFGSLLRRLFAY
jgi:hypothetical protein